MNELEIELMQMYRDEIQQEHHRRNLIRCYVDLHCGTIIKPVNHIHVTFKAMPRLTVPPPLPKDTDLDELLPESFLQCV